VKWKKQRKKVIKNKKLEQSRAKRKKEIEKRLKNKLKLKLLNQKNEAKRLQLAQNRCVSLYRF